MKTGYIILFNSKGIIDKIQLFLYKLFANKSNITHVAIFYDDKFIAEAKWFMRLYPFKKLNKNNICVIKFKGKYSFDIFSSTALKNKFENIIGEQYDYLDLIIAFFYIVFKIKLKIRKKNTYICSELVYDLLTNLNDDEKNNFLKCKNRNYCYPYHFKNLKNNKFIEIVYQGKNFKW